MALLHFLLIYDRVRGMLAAEPAMFEDASEAAKAYAEIEWQHRGNPDLEIVLIGSDSIETVQQTHRNYFVVSGAVPFAGVGR